MTKGATRAFIAAYRAAFDADPLATFCAGEIDGLTIVVAVGQRGRELRDFVEAEWDGTIQRAISTAHVEDSPSREMTGHRRIISPARRFLGSGGLKNLDRRH